MREVFGNLWGFHAQGAYVVITTNGFVKNDGACVMGRGIALEAKRRFPSLPYRLGGFIQEKGNRVFGFPDLRLLTFPVKHVWWEKADLRLIERSARELAELVVSQELPTPLYLVRPGCGNGQLSWDEVKPVLASLLNDQFVVVEKER